ncbi:hypothetical protein EG329_007923 [Mollisiaceae sp. DMI_Dod_QoI]|nr:hypothetical protein EG329_007923 [Helotiales sp. DMI_Dod_QoI]
MPPCTVFGPRRDDLPWRDNPRRQIDILHLARASPPQQIPPLAKPDYRDFRVSLPSNIEEARSLLIQQRTSEPGYRPPEQQIRHVFRLKNSKEAKCNTAKWTFTKHEVAKTFDSLLSRTPLPVPGIAQALLHYASVASLEELWCHFKDPKLEKRMGSLFKNLRSSTLPKSLSSLVLDNRPLTLETTSAMVDKITWLDKVCDQENLKYILLMCQAGLDQDTLNLAYEIALRKHSIDAMEMLLSFGAVASAFCEETIQNHSNPHDDALVRLLLSAPGAMSGNGWRRWLELKPEWIRSPELLLLCLAHRPDVACMRLLGRALGLRNLPATAIIIAYGDFSGESYHDSRQLACKFVSRIQDDGSRHRFFTVLVESEFVADSLVLREELVKDVKIRHLPLIKLLAAAGVIVDMEPHNALSWAVSNMDFDILELFKRGTFTSPISLVLEFIPSSTSESDMLRLVEILGPLGLAGQPLDSYLIRAVRRRYHELVAVLIFYGASIEYKKASAIQTALENADLDMLNILLQERCSAKLLSATIPTAMVLSPRDIRLQAMEALLKKGVLPQKLGIPLQSLVSEEDDVDFELIQLLLQYKPSVEGVGDDSNNVVLVAVRRGNLSILRMLCDAGLRSGLLSQAIPVAFSVVDFCEYDVALKMIKLLLQKGAIGLPVHQTLLAAAKQDRLEIVRLLVQHGADANYASGASFGIALTTSNFKLLQILCSSCSLNRASIESGIFVAFDPRYYTAEALELLLSSTQSAGAALNALWSPQKMTGNPNIVAIVPCLLRHGLDVNLRNGDLLSFAIRENNIFLLDRILCANPSITSLSAAFRTACYAQPKSLNLDAMRLLLEKADSAEIGQTEFLSKQIRSVSDDFECIKLLLLHKAVVTPFTFTKACLATASSTRSWNEKQEIYESLLVSSAGVSTEDLSKLLSRSVMGYPECTQLPKLLLANGAELKQELLKGALTTSSLELLEVLMHSIKSADTVLRMFRHARQVMMASERRYWIYQHLLTKRIPSDDISEALLDSLEADHLGDLSCAKLLLENGASAGYEEGEPFSIALRANSQNSLVAVKLLTQHLVDSSMATVAFDVVRKTPMLKTHVRLEIYRWLLGWNISKSSLSQALKDSFKNGRPDTSLLQLLLEKGANPNIDNGQCFATAAKTGALAEFQVLSKYAKRWVVLRALLNTFQEESKIIEWFKRCFEERPRSGKIDQDELDELAFQCMQKLPAGTTLLKFLLDQGVSASAKMPYCFCPNWKPESCTALIWALFSKPRIENNVILVILSQGYAALPAYSTPSTKVSAAFGCLLDKTRIPILKALLDLDRDRISDYTIPGSSLGTLSMYPLAFKEDSLLDPTHEYPLREASLFLGNFEAFRLIAREVTPNDGTLHVAALLALPNFVKMLLTTHDPNHEAEDMDKMIPLALVCASKSHPWCKIANEEADWEIRQKETIHLLASVTSPQWRHRNMTILHYAMDHGVRTAKAMVGALGIGRDPAKNEKYLYKDRDGIEYSPQQYVEKVWGGNKQEKIALKSCLKDAGLKSRYFKRILPNEGDQPPGYHGLPSDYAKVWEVYEKSLLQADATNEEEECLKPLTARFEPASHGIRHRMGRSEPDLVDHRHSRDLRREKRSEPDLLGRGYVGLLRIAGKKVYR